MKTLQIKNTSLFIVVSILVTTIIVGIALQFRPFSKVNKMPWVTVDMGTEYQGFTREYELQSAGNGDLPAEESYVIDSNIDDNMVIKNSLMDLDQIKYKTPSGTSYELVGDVGIWSLAQLMVNDKKVWQQSLFFTTHDPILNSFGSEEAFVFAYAKYPYGDNADLVTEYNVIFNGIDANASYGFTRSFSPFPITKYPGKYFFFAQKEKQMYLVVDQAILKLPYEEIIDPPCCSPAMFAVRSDGEKVGFYGKREGKWYYVVSDIGKIVEKDLAN